MQLVGDFAKLGLLRKSLRDLAAVPSQVSKDVATRLDQRVNDCFANETDVYGKPFASLKASTVRRKKGNTVIMYRTGRTQAQSGAVAMAGAGVRVYIGPAGYWHLEKSGTRPERLLLPKYRLPKTWREDIRLAFEARARRALGKA